MFQQLNQQLAHQRQHHEPQGVRRRSLQVALLGRQREQRRLER
jgi:hypothetical protein